MRVRTSAVWVVIAMVAASLLPLIGPSAAAPMASGPSGPIGFTSNTVGTYLSWSVATSADGTAINIAGAVGIGHAKLLASRFTPGGGWSPLELIYENDCADAYSGKVVMDAHGNGFVAFWVTGATDDVYVIRYLKGSGWMPPEILEAQAGQAQRPDIASTADGTVFVTWYQDDSAYYSTYARRYTMAGGWGPVVNVESLTGHGYNIPSVGVDGAGNAIVVWNQDDPPHFNTFWNRYTAGSGWGTAAPLESDTNDTVTAQVSVGPDGTAVASWSSNGDGRGRVFARAYTPAGGWGPQTAFSTSAGSIQSATPLVDALGGGMVFYSFSDGVRFNGWAAHYSAGTGWGSPALFENSDTFVQNQFDKTQVACDGAGNYLIAFTSSDGYTPNETVSTYMPGRGWDGGVRIDDTGEMAQSPSAALWANGAGWIFWPQYNGTRNQMVGASYQFADVAPPPLTFTAAAETTQPSVIVSGGTEPGARVQVNGVEAAVASDGKFQVRISLASGTNLLAVSATDDWGNTANGWTNVTFNDPVPALQLQLDAAEAALAAAELEVADAVAQVDQLSGQLGAANASLASAQANLTAAQAAIVALQASGNATEDDLAAANAVLSAAVSSVGNLTAAQANLTTQLGAANAAAAAAQASATAAQTAATAAQANATAAQTAAAGQSAAVTEAKSSASTAFMIGFVGLLIGALGAAMGVMAMKRQPSMSNAQTNPLYNEAKNTGTNPLHEKKE